MTWDLIAMQEAKQSYEARSIRFLLGLVVLVSVIGGYVYPVFGQEPYTTAQFSGFVSGWLATLVPLVGLVIGYNAIVSERTAGSLFLTLSMPYSRRDVVLGKFVGRAGLVAIAVVAGLVLAGALVVYPFGEFVPFRFVGFVVATIGLGTIYTGIGLAISMVSASKPRATVAAFGIYFLFAVIWTEIQSAVAFGLDALGLIEEDLPDLLTFLFASEPGSAYGRIITGFIDPSRSIDGAWYLNEWVALVVFCIWAVVPIGLAFRRFRGSDL